MEKSLEQFDCSMSTVLTEENVKRMIWDKSMIFITVFWTQEFYVVTYIITDIHRRTQAPLCHGMLSLSQGLVQTAYAKFILLKNCTIDSDPQIGRFDTKLT